MPSYFSRELIEIFGFFSMKLNFKYFLSSSRLDKKLSGPINKILSLCI